MARRLTNVLGPEGLPVEMDFLEADDVMPASTLVRRSRFDGVASGLDPLKLARILRQADEGDNTAMLTLAEEMEERDPHYSSVLGQRKRAVSGIVPVVQAGKTHRQEVVDAVTTLIEAPAFAALVDDLLDAPAKGYAVVKPVWRTRPNSWTPIRYEGQDPRLFCFDRETLRELRIRDDAEIDGRPIRPWSLIVHRPHLKSGLTVRAGLARLCAWSFMLKTFTLQDWAAFLEVFGMPLRVGKYDKNASPAEKRVLLRAVRDLATDAAAIIPMGMEIDFIEAKGGSGNAVFGAMADYLDKQISKAVIGQTMTTDEGSSRAQSEIHNEVRSDIRQSDARQMGTTITRDLITPFVAWNFGPEEPVPAVAFPAEDPEDIKAFTEAVARMVPLGQPVAITDVAKRMGLRVPEKGEALLSVAAAAPAPKVETARAACPGCGTVHRASAETPAEEDPLISAALEEWERDMAPIIMPILKAAEAAASYEDFLAALDGMEPDTAALAKRLATVTMKARGDGNIG